MHETNRSIGNGREFRVVLRGNRACSGVPGMKMTVKKLADMIGEGRGLGAGDRYQPWEQISRRRASPFSNLNLIPVPHLTRLAHFLSRGEREFGLLLWWLGAEDVREQYPLWPWPHRQPLDQIRAGGPEMKPHPGMLSVARDAGIRLSNYPGLNVQAVLSIRRPHAFSSGTV